MDQILSSIDAEIAKLEEAKRLLSGSPDLVPSVVRRGRPMGSTKAAPVKAKRVMSAEGRARIAEAQRKRHAARKRAAKKAAAAEAASE